MTCINRFGATRINLILSVAARIDGLWLSLAVGHSIAVGTVARDARHWVSQTAVAKASVALALTTCCTSVRWPHSKGDIFAVEFGAGALDGAGIF